MSSRIQIRHGKNEPLDNSLFPYELGFKENDNNDGGILYIGKNEGIPIKLFDTDELKNFIIKGEEIPEESLPIIPIEKGGTGASTVELAVINLKVLSLSGGTMEGPLDVQDPEYDTNAANKKYVDAKYEFATLIADNWGESVPYTQTISIEGVNSQKPPRITPVYSGITEEDLSLVEATSLVSYAKPGDNSITFTCLEDKPMIDIKIQIELRN